MAFECPKGKSLRICSIQPSKNRDKLALDSQKGKSDIVNLKCEELVEVDEVVSECRTITGLPLALISEIFNCLEPKELEPILCSDEKSWKELLVDREFRSKTFMGRYTVDMLYGHTEDVRKVFVLSSKKLVFTSGYDQIVRIDWVWNLAPHDTTVASTAGSDLNVWDTNSGSKLAIINNAHAGYTYSLPRSHTGKLLYTGGEDGVIHMFEIFGNARYHVRQVATRIPHLSAVYSLAFEFPWLWMLDVTELCVLVKKVLLGSVCAGEEGVVRIWNFSQALEIEQRVRALRGLRLENRMRRRNCQLERNGKGRRGYQCSFAEKKQMDGDRNSCYNNRRRMVWKEVTGPSLGNSLWQKCKVRLRTTDPCGWDLPQTLSITEALVQRTALSILLNLISFQELTVDTGSH
ncbi:hypothetical protein CQW23_15640 [Capsicum baccatum]|uniref:Uncharacterized protein n=1 Tax=Capsicum baccatum TaxID=33114 RepID=A0A2G2WMN1_CAPBA|nr:hypothetical protein CQW23_15640 [Capsicum baccatum]